MFQFAILRGILAHKKQGVKRRWVKMIEDERSTWRDQPETILFWFPENPYQNVTYTPDGAQQEGLYDDVALSEHDDSQVNNGSLFACALRI